MPANQPTPKPKRAPQARTARTRARILTEARQAIAENGFEATTTLDIARRAEVAEGSVFAHFTNKQGLLLALMQDHYATITQQVQAIASDTPDPGARLQALLLFHLDNLKASWPELRAYAHYGRYGSAEMTTAFRSLNRHYTQVFMASLQELMTNANQPADWPLEALRDMIFGTAEHWAFRAMELDQDMDPTQAVSFIMSRLNLPPDPGSDDSTTTP